MKAYRTFASNPVFFLPLLLVGVVACGDALGTEGSDEGADTVDTQSVVGQWEATQDQVLYDGDLAAVSITPGSDDGKVVVTAFYVDSTASDQGIDCSLGANGCSYADAYAASALVVDDSSEIAVGDASGGTWTVDDGETGLASLGSGSVQIAGGSKVGGSRGSSGSSSSYTKHVAINSIAAGSVTGGLVATTLCGKSQPCGIAVGTMLRSTKMAHTPQAPKASTTTADSQSDSTPDRTIATSSGATCVVKDDNNGRGYGACSGSLCTQSLPGRWQRATVSAPASLGMSCDTGKCVVSYCTDD